MHQLQFLFFFGCLSLSTNPAFASDFWNGRVIDVHSDQQISEAELGMRLAASSFVILAEKHYAQAVQLGQARVIRSTVAARDLNARDFTLGWEFLNFSDQDRISDFYGQFTRGEIDATTFLEKTQGYAPAISYAPIFEAARDLEGDLLPVNLSRAQKAPVLKGGIEAADPTLVPPGFEMGSQGYYERFKRVMEDGHTSETQIPNYFAAQCLTDDVMAYHLAALHTTLNFLVVGSFHAEYEDGVISRLRARSAGASVRTVRFIDASDYNESELQGLLHDSEYGDLADFVMYVNEPSAP